MKEKIEKEYNIIGKNLTPEKKKELNYYLEGRKDGAMEPIEGEYIKTLEELKFVKYINKYLNEEFQGLGIKRKVEIKPEQIHILPSDIYKKVLPGIEYKACFVGLNQGVYIDKHAHKTRLKLREVMFHEAVHMASFSRFFKKSDEDVLKPYRTGYNLFNKGKGSHVHFRGLNEMITDAVAVEIIKKHQNELVKKFKITDKEQNEGMDRYPRVILETIIRKLAKKNNEKEEDIWNKFKKNMFIGNMIHLREIEKAFGRGSLRVLAALDCGTKRELSDSDAYDKILEYFQTDSEKKREQIAEDVLIEREKIIYKKLKQ